jgi:hypothetical protein
MKNIIVLVALLLVSFVSFGQREVDFEEKPSFKDRTFFGGGLSMGGANDAFFLSVSPIAGYMLTEKWSAGVGVNYTYANYRNIDQNDNQWGFLTFTRYNIFQQFFLQAQYDYISFNRFIPVFDQTGVLYEKERDSYGRVLAGGGITQPIGGRGAMNIVAMYDLSYSNTRSPYGSPWVFQVYFSF